MLRYQRQCQGRAIHRKVQKFLLKNVNSISRSKTREVKESCLSLNLIHNLDTKIFYVCILTYFRLSMLYLPHLVVHLNAWFYLQKRYWSSTADCRSDWDSIFEFGWLAWSLVNNQSSIPWVIIFSECTISCW